MDVIIIINRPFTQNIRLEESLLYVSFVSPSLSNLELELLYPTLHSSWSSHDSTSVSELSPAAAALS